MVLSCQKQGFAADFFPSSISGTRGNIRRKIGNTGEQEMLKYHRLVGGLEHLEHGFYAFPSIGNSNPN